MSAAVANHGLSGHTSIMWAAYQGDALSVELLLKHGASISVRDNAGLTPLHWAVVRGNKARPHSPLPLHIRLNPAPTDMHPQTHRGRCGYKRAR
jgi:ankyrin repeat protein